MTLNSEPNPKSLCEKERIVLYRPSINVQRKHSVGEGVRCEEFMMCMRLRMEVGEGWIGMSGMKISDGKERERFITLRLYCTHKLEMIYIYSNRD